MYKRVSKLETIWRTTENSHIHCKPCIINGCTSGTGTTTAAAFRCCGNEQVMRGGER